MIDQAEPSSKNNGTDPFEMELVANALMMRDQMFKRLLDPRRDYDKECGYPDTGSLTPQTYRKLFDRDPIAARVVECLPDECWKVRPTVYEDENTETVTEFEKAWDSLNESLKGGSNYKSEKDSPVWDYLYRADVLSGIGSFGVILLGLDDLEEEESLSKPAPGYEEETGLLTNKEDPKKTEVSLKFLRVFDESLVEVSSYETRKTSPRYGQPVIYRITMVDPEDQNKGGTGQTVVTEDVHWSRVIHIADNRGSSEIFGNSRMKVVYNRLLDLTKLYGGSAEMYWKGAFPGISLNIDPKMAGGTTNIDDESIKNAMWNYTNSLQRWFALQGVSASTLSPQVVDPASQINVHLEAICVKLAIPKRIFLGSERGELASSQDAGSWNGRLKSRQGKFITPSIIIPFVDRLIQIGVLPEPKKGFQVSWEPLESLSENDKASLANTQTQAMGAYISGQLESLIEPMDWMTRILRLSEEEAKSILDNRRRSIEDESNAKGIDSDLAKLSQMAKEDYDEDNPTDTSPQENVPVEEEGGNNPVTGNVFCPTGRGGGVDATCSPKKMKSPYAAGRRAAKNIGKGDVARKIIKVAKKAWAVFNAGPTFAKETAIAAGASPEVGQLAYTAATVGDWVVPGIPAGSVIVTMASSIKKPTATYLAAKSIIQDFKTRSKPPITIHSNVKQSSRKLTNRIIRSAVNHLNPEEWILHYAVAVDEGYSPTEAVDVVNEVLNLVPTSNSDEFGEWKELPHLTLTEDDLVFNSKGQVKSLNKPFRTKSGPKKFAVYTKNDKGTVVKVSFGDPNMEIKRDDPERLKAFRSRHGCDTDPGPKWKPKYWSCKFWEKGKSVSELLNKG